MSHIVDGARVRVVKQPPCSDVKIGMSGIAHEVFVGEDGGTLIRVAFDEEFFLLCTPDELEVVP